jgi:hypothetical protein
MRPQATSVCGLNPTRTFDFYNYLGALASIDLEAAVLTAVVTRLVNLFDRRGQQATTEL